ncbi:putative diheme cytochrome c-553 [Candidatus Burkholderia verschuerenii]|uniref:Putative diheme cytochrome c-553 n=1 Tax=Candidatus Burkholderia verschuerenii TaxID=242163 RepID=A0A0L0MDL2_9BURK|nr:cytochrome c [Candidatus Burkholderia verschuerenii]KND60386.1 putative diheme cytochrome c-553 [Candidatus Burkholderia verschuerenii]
MKNIFRVCSGLLLAAFVSGAFAASADDAQLIARGRYLATAADCAGCHTAPQGKPFAGGYGIDSPFGQIWSSNITPSKTQGIGAYSERDFARAVREGVDANGRHLYPAMPYPSYAGIADDDMKALYAYFMHGVDAVDTATPDTTLPFPFSQRWLMAGWNLAFANGKPFVPDASKSAAFNRGHYLVEALGHCGACHTPRNFAFAEKPYLPLAGGQLGAWQTPNITSDPVSGIGGWTQAELVQYLRTGTVPGKAQAAGGMAEAVQASLQHLSDDDLNAIATYLKASKPVRNPVDVKPAYAYDGTHAGGYEAALRATNQGIGVNSTTPGFMKLTTGAQLYSGNCASCQPSGAGTSDGAFLSLTHNSTLGRHDADNLVMVILNGLHIQTGKDDRPMPAFADDLNDEPGRADRHVRDERVRQSRRQGRCATREGAARGRRQSGRRSRLRADRGSGDRAAGDLSDRAVVQVQTPAQVVLLTR